MTSEEITLALKQYLPIPDDVRELMKGTWGNTPWKWPFIAVSINKDKNLKDLITLCPTSSDLSIRWEKHKENIKEDPESHRVLFVPELISDALARWMVIEPAHEMTRSLIFSQFKVVLSPESKTLKDIIEYIDERKVALIDMLAKSGVVQQRRRLQRPPPTEGPGMRVDIDICESESGYCNYTATRSTRSFHMCEGHIEEIRNIVSENDGVMDEALDRLRQIINDNMYDEDHETGDYDYDSYDAQDSEIESDNTDYDAILEEILEE